MKFLVIATALVVHQTMATNPTELASKASNLFSTQLYQELAKEPGNVLVCPFSLHIALALVHQGAGGDSAAELANVLRLSGTNSDIKESYKALFANIQDDILKVATKLFPAINFTPKQDYVSLARQYFHSDVQALDYNKASEAAGIINKYVEDNTNNKIHDIVSPDSLSGLTRLILVNAVHFKATWLKTFPPAYEGFFKVTPIEKVQTLFLTQTDFFEYKEDPTLEAKVLKMDYRTGSYSMVFVLPNKEDGLPALEAKLANYSLDNLLNGLKSERVEVTIPKFKIEQELQLVKVLQKMGIQQLFGNKADLSGITDEKGLYVSEVIQKTFIDVDEKGTEAAAATGVIETLSANFEENIFSARRPFHFFLLRSAAPAAILFEGRLVQPHPVNQSESLPQHIPQNSISKIDDNIYFSESVEGDLEMHIRNRIGTYNLNKKVESNPNVDINGSPQTPRPNLQALPQSHGQQGQGGHFPEPSPNTQYNAQVYVRNQLPQSHQTVGPQFQPTNRQYPSIQGYSHQRLQQNNYPPR